MKIDNNPLVEFVDVQKTYDGEELVVKNLNLDIASGEFLTMSVSYTHLTLPTNREV